MHTYLLILYISCRLCINAYIILICKLIHPIIYIHTMYTNILVYRYIELPPGAISGNGMVGEYVQKFVIIDWQEQGGQNYYPYVCMLSICIYYIVVPYIISMYACIHLYILSYTLIVILSLLDPSGSEEGAQRIVMRQGDTLCVPRGNIYVSRAATVS